MSKFKHFKQLYQDNKFDVLLKEAGSIYWLKLRSISRKELLDEFCTLANIDCSNVRGTALFEHVYKLQPSEELLDKFIAQKFLAERSERKANETALVSELYKMKVFDWGGLYQNKNNLEESWKMKRNLDLLKDTINGYLDKFNGKSDAQLKIEFDWIDGKRYTALSDIIFVIKD
ncbi:MAG: hypothetical protein ABII74_01115 [Elusimicrobiota bacterium]